MAPGRWLFFTASILSSWNIAVGAQVTITLVPERATVGGSIMFSVHSVPKDVLSFTWYRESNNSANKFSVIRPGERSKRLFGNQSKDHVLTHINGSLMLKNLSSRDSGLYLIKVNTLDGEDFWSEKYIQVYDSQDSSGTSQSREINLIFLVTTAVLAALVIAGGLGCILCIRNTKRASQKQMEDLRPGGESHAARIQKKVFHTYENDSQSRVLHTYENQSQPAVLHTYENQSQPAVLHTYENNPQAGDRMATTQEQSFASASSSTLSEKAYQEIDVTKVDVYDQIIHPRSQGGRKMSQR
ncbi:carcinoembryonic antigen-related cell adhesion molecule 3-like [Trichosurus vulpecula]|uniref:carcinoembryonic antigen-related cell adhesion molecule 3-like n=1 Tax=Trichosurus vulpecula TaxID=9337 RepID=UPI00186ABDAA|nr:carcinoembryonic antigen-related cell adhesion molecule 3-like [Trichosurus vulpecula]